MEEVEGRSVVEAEDTSAECLDSVIMNNPVYVYIDGRYLYIFCIHMFSIQSSNTLPQFSMIYL